MEYIVRDMSGDRSERKRKRNKSKTKKLNARHLIAHTTVTHEKKLCQRQYQLKKEKDTRISEDIERK